MILVYLYERNGYMPFSHLKGRNLMLCDMIYAKPSKITDYHDYLTVIYKDLVTQKKELTRIKDPGFTIFEVKEEYRTFEKPRQHLPLSHLIPHEIKYKNLYKEIAKIGGGEWEKYYNTHRSDYERRYLFKYPYVMGADIPIETYYRVIWEKQLGNDLKKDVTCQFMDIEVNQKHWDGSGIPRHGECPIDAVSLVDDSTNTVYTFLLRVPDNPLIDDFIKNIDNVQTKLHEMFDEIYGVMTYNIYMFDSELEMLHKLFSLIHSLKRDFIMIWNMSFDIPYVIDRIRALGEDPANVMCHSDIPGQKLYYREDANTFEFAEKRDYFDISSYSHYIDQLIQYASLRKSQGAVKKVNLGAIGQKELGDTKLDYTDAGNFIEFSYQDYTRYVIYNIKDTLLQMGINRKCKDMLNYYFSVYNSYCGYKDGLKQTVSLGGLIYKELDEQNLVLGNNVNFDNGSTKSSYDDDEDEDDSFEGALNGNPMLNEHEGLVMFGKRSMFIFGSSIDLDFSAMYPNSICAFNIFVDCMIGKLILYDCDDRMTYSDDAGREFVEDITSNTTLEIGEKWFDLPSFDEITDEINRRLNI